MSDTIVHKYTQTLLQENRGGTYIMSRFGNSQLVDPPRALFVPKYQCESFLNARESSDVGFCLSELDGFFALKNSIVDTIGGVPAILCDNHNTVAHAWGVAFDHGLLRKGVSCIHIDEHSDLWGNNNLPENFFDQGSVDWWEYAHMYCNVGNYIRPLIDSGYLGEFIRVEGEEDLERVKTPSKFGSGYILNIDLDYWSEDLDYIPWSKSMPIIRSLFAGAGLITIATSPSFIPFPRAYRALEILLSSE